MKKIILFTVLVCICQLATYAQTSPIQTFNYQGSVRQPDGTPYAGKDISLRLSILTDHTTEYSEVRQLTTNSMGLYSVQVGSEGATQVLNNQKISDLKWNTGDKYFKVEIDPNGGEYFVPQGEMPIVAVPMAMYAAKGGSSGYNTWLTMPNNSGKSELEYLQYLKIPSAKTTQTISTDYTLSASDHLSVILVAGSKNIAISAPANLPAGFECTLIQKNGSEYSTTISGVQNVAQQYQIQGQYGEVNIYAPQSELVLLKGQTK